MRNNNASDFQFRDCVIDSGFVLDARPAGSPVAGECGLILPVVPYLMEGLLPTASFNDIGWHTGVPQAREFSAVQFMQAPATVPLKMPIRANFSPNPIGSRISTIALALCSAHRRKTPSGSHIWYLDEVARHGAQYKG
jgi:hypothetical protein